MGKNPEFAKENDVACVGISSELNDGRHLLFMDIDKPIIEEALKDIKDIADFMTGEDLPFIFYKTKKGIHAVCLNSFEEREVIRIWSELLNYVDRWHIGYSIAKGFTTLRISKKSPDDYFELIEFYPGNLNRYISRPHYMLLCSLLPDLKEEYPMRNTFDKGIKLVGYIIDSDKDDGIR